jgi:hypothetical protein
MAQLQTTTINPNGINKDISPYELPAGQWSDGNNIQFDNDKTKKILGHSQVFGSLGTPPYWLLHFSTPSVNYWFYPSLTKIYRTDGTSHTNVTRVNKVLTGSINPTASTSVVGVGTAFTTELILGESILVSGETRIVSAIADNTHLTVSVAFTDTANDTSPELVQGNYSASAAYGWNGGVLGGVAILNNGIDVPQMIGSAGSTFSTLSNWLGNTTCSVIRPFKQFLVALDTTESSSRYPFRVRWSHPAEGGTVPVTWDASDATKDAGYVDLSQTNGFVVDSLPLKDINVIYKEDSVWGMAFEGGQSIFRFFEIFNDAGILGRRCVKAFDENHFVVSNDDVYIHNGQTKQSVIDSKMRDELFDSIHASYYDRTFVAPNYESNEMWICFVSGANTTDAFADKAFVYNWRNQTWSKRDLPHVSHIGWGILGIASGATNWDGDSASWDTDTESWDYRGYNPSQTSLLMADATNSKLFESGKTNQFNSVNYLSYIEKTSMSLGYSGTKSVNKIVPRLEGTGSVNFYVGQEMLPNEGITWKGPYAFTPGTHSEIPVRVTGNYIAVKAESTDNNSWSLDNMEIHWSPSGNRGNGV